MDKILQMQEQFRRRFRLISGTAASVFLVGYGILCIVRGYCICILDFRDAIDRGRSIFVSGSEATATGLEYFGWALLIVTLYIWREPLGWYAQLLRFVMLLVSVAVIVSALFVRDVFWTIWLLLTALLGFWSWYRDKYRKI